MVVSAVHLSDVDYKDLASNPDKLVAGANPDYVAMPRKKRRSSSGSASSATASSKKRSKKSTSSSKDPPQPTPTTTNHTNDMSNNDSQVAVTNHERIPEVVVKKVFVSYFENTDERIGSGIGPRNDM